MSPATRAFRDGFQAGACTILAGWLFDRGEPLFAVLLLVIVAIRIAIILRHA